MVTQKIGEIEQYRKKIAELEKQVAAERKSELRALPAKFGYATMKEFIRALRTLGGGQAAGPGRRRRGKRARITPEMRNEIKAALQSGKKGVQVAKEFGISVPSIQNIKKEFGLVRKRGKK